MINSQGKLLILMCMGILIASWSILTLASDDNPTDPFNANLCFVATPVLFCSGFQIALLAAIGKLNRIAVLFHTAATLKTYSYSIYRVFGLITIAISLEIIIVITWIFVAPLTFTRIILQLIHLGIQ